MREYITKNTYGMLIHVCLDYQVAYIERFQVTLKRNECFIIRRHIVYLKERPCKLYNNKHGIVLTQITKTEIFAFIVVVVFKLLSREVLFINRKGNRNC